MFRKKVLIFASLLTLVLLLGVASHPETSHAAQKVNINTASVEVLQDLDGVGPALAERIVEYREDHPFQSPQEITEVKGIGQKTYADNKDRIAVE